MTQYPESKDRERAAADSAAIRATTRPIASTATPRTSKPFEIQSIVSVKSTRSSRRDRSFARRLADHRACADDRRYRDRIRRGVARGRRSADQAGAGADDLVDEAVVLGRLGGEPEVAVGVPADALDGLPGPFGEDRVDSFPEERELPGMDLDVAGGALDPAVRLVDEDAGVRR